MPRDLRQEERHAVKRALPKLGMLRNVPVHRLCAGCERALLHADNGLRQVDFGQRTACKGVVADVFECVTEGGGGQL